MQDCFAFCMQRLQVLQSDPVLGWTGSGWVEAVDTLISLGAQIEARDMTSCTPLHNAAHGTYSALAALPPEGKAGACKSPDLLAHQQAVESCFVVDGGMHAANGGRMLCSVADVCS